MYITTQNIPTSLESKSIIQAENAQLNRHYPDILSSKCHVAFHTGFEDFEVELTVHLDNQSIFIIRTDRDANAAIEEAFQALKHKLTQYGNRQKAKRYLMKNFRALFQRVGLA
ncbi:HPF/RaiA family ribosome-associated protein [Vibrio sp. E150_011]